MNWLEFDLFLIRQLDKFRLSQSSKSFELEDPFGVEESSAEELFSDRSPMSIPTDRTFDSVESGRSINWTGARDMYVNAWIREFKDIPIKIGATGTALGFSRFPWNTVFGAMRVVPMSIAISQTPRTLMMWNMMIQDALAGKWPGTDESFFM